MVSIFGEKKQKNTPETDAAREKLQQLIGRDDLRVTEFKPFISVFNKDEKPTGYHGVAPIAAKIDEDWYFTNVVIDPLGRTPPLGKPNSVWTASAANVFAAPKIEEPESSRGLPRNKFKAKSTKIGSMLADNTDFITNGRTLINGAELLKLQDEHELGPVSIILLAWNLIKPDIEKQFYSQLLHDTVMVSSEDGGNFKSDVLMILGAQGLDKSSWSEGLIILTRDPGNYYATEEESDASEALAKTTLQNNIYKTPILVDLSVVTKNWVCKVVTSLPKPRPGIGKRRALETSVFITENDTKRQEQEINDQISELNDIFNDFRTETSADRQLLLLNRHTELAARIQDRCYQTERSNEDKMSHLHNEIKMLSNKLQEQRKQQQTLQEAILVEETNNQSEIENQKKNIKNLEEEINRLVASKASEDELDKVKTEKQQLIAQKNALEHKLTHLNTRYQTLSTENEDLNNQLNEVTEKLNEATDVDQKAKMKVSNLKESAKKQRQLISETIKKSWSPQRMSVNFESDSEDETDSKILSPSSLIKKTNCKVSNLNISLNPRKAGLSVFNENEDSFGTWWIRNEMQIQLLEGQIGSENTLRMILMNLPSSMQWISQSLPANVSKDLKKAKKAILELLYGKSGNLSNFLSLTKGVTEHPIAFLVRMRNELESASSDLSNLFVLETICEKLIKNIDQTLSLEVKRQLVEIKSFEDILNALKKALVLTSQSVIIPSLAQSLSFTGNRNKLSINKRNSSTLLKMTKSTS